MRPADGPAVWLGGELAASEAWIYRLSGAHLDELDDAIDRVRRRGLRIMDIGRDDFPLPSLGHVLAELQDDVINGRGFVLIKRIPVERYSRADAQTIYWGIGTHFGDAVSQNGKGHVLGHVKDLEMAEDDPARRGYQTTMKLRYHTDSCDIVGLMCLVKAKSGGLSSITSSAAVHNAILERRPDLLKVLTEPFYIDRKCEVPEGKLPYFPAPVFNYTGGHLTCFYPRGDLESGQRFPEVPRLTDKQREALEMFDDLAEEFSLKMDIEEGDIQFLHNHVICHARTALEDHPQFDRKRHLVRLWLSAPNGRPLPACFAERYGTVAVGAVRGGIIVPGTMLNAPTEAL